MNITLQNARAVGETKVALLYSDDLSAVLNLASILTGPSFEALHEPDYFAKTAVESDTLRWPNGADIDPDVLRLWAEKGRVLTPDETDSHFTTVEAMH